MKFCTKVKGRKVKISITLSLFYRNLSPHTAFSMRRSKQHCNEARGPIVTGNGSHDTTRPQLKIQKISILPCKTQNGINAFSTGIRSAKCLPQHISATMRDIGLVSSRPGAWRHFREAAQPPYCSETRHMKVDDSQSAKEKETEYKKLSRIWLSKC